MSEKEEEPEEPKGEAKMGQDGSKMDPKWIRGDFK